MSFEFPKSLYYLLSHEIENYFSIKITSLEGTRQCPTYEALLKDPELRYSGLASSERSDLYVTCEIWNDNRSISLPSQTAYKSFTDRWYWNEWLSMSVRIKDLPLTAVAVFTVWDIAGTNKPALVGGTTISLFSKHGALREHRYELKLYPGIEGDGRTPSITPGLFEENQHILRLKKVEQRRRKIPMPGVDFLDRMANPLIYSTYENEKRRKNLMFFNIEFPKVFADEEVCRVIYFEQDGEQQFNIFPNPSIVKVLDPEIGMTNLIEEKHHKLIRSERRIRCDEDIKPDPNMRDRLNQIIHLPLTRKLTNDDKDLMWKYRYFLSTNSYALTKFLKSIDWSNEVEKSSALIMLTKWSCPEINDALELLSDRFLQPECRKYAVFILENSTDAELQLYLMQLVQALRFEDPEAVEKRKISVRLQVNRRKSSPAIDEHDPALGFLAPSDKTVQQHHLSAFEMQLIEYLKTLGAFDENEVKKRITTYLNGQVESGSIKKIDHRLKEFLLNSAKHIGKLPSATERFIRQRSRTFSSNQENLGDFLIQRAQANNVIANNLFWYLFVEANDERSDPKLRKMFHNFIDILKNSFPSGHSILIDFDRQKEFLQHLVKMLTSIKSEKCDRDQKIEKLRQRLAITPSEEEDSKLYNFAKFPGFALPLNPSIRVCGVISEKASLFNSALQPAKLVFRTEEFKDDEWKEGPEFATIFKLGDDLRQDQLVVQMIALMEEICKKEQIDLRLTPYKVAATSPKEGFVEFVNNSYAVAVVLKKHKMIQNFFREVAPSETDPYKIDHTVLDNYVHSCAGYCVITYLLGVGDRHLDNLMLTKDGHLFHIDFGFILDRDPKPFPPPMKLSKEMVEAMGGKDSPHFHVFRELCFVTFQALRRYANLILNLFNLMIHSNITDIALEPDKTVIKVQEKFCLGMSDEQAVQTLQNLLDVSVNALFPVVIEQIHKFAMYWRQL